MPGERFVPRTVELSAITQIHDMPQSDVVIPQEKMEEELAKAKRLAKRKFPFSGIKKLEGGEFKGHIEVQIGVYPEVAVTPKFLDKGKITYTAAREIARFDQHGVLQEIQIRRDPKSAIPTTYTKFTYAEPDEAIGNRTVVTEEFGAINAKGERSPLRKRKWDEGVWEDSRNAGKNIVRNEKGNILAGLAVASVSVNFDDPGTQTERNKIIDAMPILGTELPFTGRVSGTKGRIYAATLYPDDPTQSPSMQFVRFGTDGRVLQTWLVSLASYNGFFRTTRYDKPNDYKNGKIQHFTSFSASTDAKKLTQFVDTTYKWDILTLPSDNAKLQNVRLFNAEGKEVNSAEVYNTIRTEKTWEWIRAVNGEYAQMNAGNSGFTSRMTIEREGNTIVRVIYSVNLPNGYRSEKTFTAEEIRQRIARERSILGQFDQQAEQRVLDAHIDEANISRKDRAKARKTMNIQQQKELPRLLSLGFGRRNQRIQMLEAQARKEKKRELYSEVIKSFIDLELKEKDDNNANVFGMFNDRYEVQITKEDREQLGLI